jgi:hypothetical protein
VTKPDLFERALCDEIISPTPELNKDFLQAVREFEKQLPLEVQRRALKAIVDAFLNDEGVPLEPRDEQMFRHPGIFAVMSNRAVSDAERKNTFTLLRYQRRLPAGVRRKLLYTNEPVVSLVTRLRELAAKYPKINAGVSEILSRLKDQDYSVLDEVKRKQKENLQAQMDAASDLSQ